MDFACEKQQAASLPRCFRLSWNITYSSISRHNPCQVEQNEHFVYPHIAADCSAKCALVANVHQSIHTTIFPQAQCARHICIPPGRTEPFQTKCGETGEKLYLDEGRRPQVVRARTPAQPYACSSSLTLLHHNHPMPPVSNESSFVSSPVFIYAQPSMPTLPHSAILDGLSAHSVAE